MTILKEDFVGPAAVKMKQVTARFALLTNSVHENQSAKTAYTNSVSCDMFTTKQQIHR